MLPPRLATALCALDFPRGGKVRRLGGGAGGEMNGQSSNRGERGVGYDLGRPQRTIPMPCTRQMSNRGPPQLALRRCMNEPAEEQADRQGLVF